MITPIIANNAIQLRKPSGGFAIFVNNTPAIAPNNETMKIIDFGFYEFWEKRRNFSRTLLC
jgi:hypothetical protein